MRKAILLFLVLCMLVPVACADGFSTNPTLINQAAKSVMMLEVYNADGEVTKTGSGFVAFDNRHLITNYHVAEDANMIYAYSDTGDPYIIMDVCIADSKKDIAILQFFSPTDLTPLSLNEAGEVIRASSVIAIGSPKGFTNSISSGIVSSAFEEAGCSYIQFTAPISSGSSGGALFDDNGNVIGITTMNYDDGVGVSQNLNFAVNIKEAVDLYAQYSGESYKLSKLDQVDVNAPPPTATPKPKPTFTPKPTATPEPDYKQYSFAITKINWRTSLDKKTMYASFRIENNTDKDIKELYITPHKYIREGVTSGGLPTPIHIKKAIKAHDFEKTLEQEISIPSRTSFIYFQITEVVYADGTSDKAWLSTNLFSVDIKQ